MRAVLESAGRVAMAGTAMALARPVAAATALGGRWRVPILAYHQVAESGGYRWAVTPEAFAAHVRWLLDSGHRVIPLAALVGGGARAAVRDGVVLTFDDGHRGVLLHALPVLERHGLPATLFLTTGFVGAPEFPWVRPHLAPTADPDEYRPLDWDEVRALADSVFDLGSHSVSHAHLGRLSAPELEREVGESKARIEAATGRGVRFFAYPGGIGAYGDHDDRTRAALLRAGYQGAVVSEIGRNGRRADPFRLRRLGVEAGDSLALIRAKVVGAWSFVRAAQWAAHRALDDRAGY